MRSENRLDFNPTHGQHNRRSCLLWFTTNKGEGCRFLVLFNAELSFAIEVTTGSRREEEGDGDGDRQAQKNQSAVQLFGRRA